VPPGHSPANQNCRVAGVAHFMVNQGGFVLSLGDGHETCCTDRFVRSIVITPVGKDSFPRSIHGNAPISGRETQIIKPEEANLSIFC
jgi:hypothetical protein